MRRFQISHCRDLDGDVVDVLARHGRGPRRTIGMPPSPEPLRQGGWRSGGSPLLRRRASAGPSPLSVASTTRSPTISGTRDAPWPSRYAVPGATPLIPAPLPPPAPGRKFLAASRRALHGRAGHVSPQGARRRPDESGRERQTIRIRENAGQGLADRGVGVSELSPPAGSGHCALPRIHNQGHRRAMESGRGGVGTPAVFVIVNSRRENASDTPRRVQRHR